MKFETHSIRHGYDKKKCLVHARCCYTPDFMIATAQYLNVDGCDDFSGIMMSQSFDEGKTWSEFKEQEGLLPIVENEIRIVGCDGTPMYHKKTGKVLLLGHTASYTKDGNIPIGAFEEAGKCKAYTFYSVFDKEKNEFSKMKFVEMPEGFEECGNGSGQSLELPNGELLIPVTYRKKGDYNGQCAVMRCSFDGKDVKFIEIGNSLTVQIVRGLCEPSIIKHNDIYYLTIRNDECGLVAKSEDGLHYKDLQLWKWQDGSILQNYNTQQHWMIVDGELYLVYTRRGADNDHVFRHRAPLFAARVEDMRLLKDSEVVLVPEKGARLGNFCATEYKDGKSIVMAAEWMQPSGCENYGSDNNIYVSICG